MSHHEAAVDMRKQLLLAEYNAVVLRQEEVTEMSHQRLNHGSHRPGVKNGFVGGATGVAAGWASESRCHVTGYLTMHGWEDKDRRASIRLTVGDWQLLVNALIRGLDGSRSVGSLQNYGR